MAAGLEGIHFAPTFFVHIPIWYNFAGTFMCGTEHICSRNMLWFFCLFACLFLFVFTIFFLPSLTEKVTIWINVWSPNYYGKKLLLRLISIFIQKKFKAWVSNWALTTQYLLHQQQKKSISKHINDGILQFNFWDSFPLGHHLTLPSSTECNTATFEAVTYGWLSWTQQEE